MKASFNRSQIMKNAWSIVRAFGKTISEGLKQAWAKAKAPVKTFTMTYAQWVEDNNTYLMPQPPAQFMHEVRNDWKGINIIELTPEHVIFSNAQ